MNREIKFRVWDLEKKFYLNQDDEFHFYEPDRGWQCPIPLCECLRDKKRYVVQQYTGLTDKNGKEIYEGDIVKTIYVNDPVNDIGNIIYHVETGAYRIKTSKHLLPIVTYRFIEDEPQGLLQVADEIIGNIFENPELLK